LCFDLEE